MVYEYVHDLLTEVRDQWPALVKSVIKHRAHERRKIPLVAEITFTNKELENMWMGMSVAYIYGAIGEYA